MRSSATSIDGVRSIWGIERLRICPNRPSTRKAVADGCVPMSLGAARPPGTCLGVTERCHFPELQRERDVVFGLCASCVCNTYINRFRSGADF